MTPTVRDVQINWIGLNPSLAMRTLGRNIEVAGALCAAFRHGQFFGCEGAWWPGCGRAVR